MSYDIEVYTKTTHHSDNYTSNVADMYYKAYERAKEIEEKLYREGVYKWHELTYLNFKDALNSKDRETSLRTLELMIQAMKEAPEAYTKLNPKNGWGDYKGAVEFLENTYKVLLTVQNSYIEIDA